MKDFWHILLRKPGRTLTQLAQLNFLGPNSDLPSLTPEERARLVKDMGAEFVAMVKAGNPNAEYMFTLLEAVVLSGLVQDKGQ